MTLLRHRIFQVFCLLGLYLILAPFLPQITHQVFYTVSVLIKDILLWILPITVTFFIAHAIASFERKAPFFILSLFLFEALSNALSVWYSYGVGHLAIGHVAPLAPGSLSDTFSTLWRLPFTKPSWFSPDKGTFLGIALGLIAVFRHTLYYKINKGKQYAEWILTKVFSRLIPLFVLGFVAKMYQTHLLSQMVSHYANFLIWITLALTLYVLFLFLLSSGFSFPRFLKHMRNLLPAGGMAFSSGCSLSTMPWTIEGAGKNLQNSDFAKAVIPLTTNVQQIGDCIAQAVLCFMIYTHFNGHTPTLSVWIPFTIAFVLARFATAAVLGGAIFIMLPLYEHYLGFSAEMIAIVLAFNLILDPLITSSNVLANGALCSVFEKGWNALLRRMRKGGEAISKT